MQEEDIALGYGRGGGDQIRPDPVGIDREGPNVRRRVRNQPLGESHKPSVLLDRQLAVIAMLDQPAQAGLDHLGSHTHLARYSLRSGCWRDGDMERSACDGRLLHTIS